MQDHTSTIDLTAAIITATETFLHGALTLALSAKIYGPDDVFGLMRDVTANLAVYTAELEELLKIQTSRTHPAREHYTPADPTAVADAIRAYLLTEIAKRAGITESDGTIRLLAA